MTNHADTYRKQYAEDEASRDKAAAYVAGVLTDLADGDIDESYVYATKRGHIEKFLLAGGGPTVWAVFEIDGGEATRGHIEYTPFGRTATAPIPDWRVPELYKALVASVEGQP